MTGSLVLTLTTHDRLTFDLPVHDHPPWQDHWYYSVGNHFFQTLAISPKWRVDWNKYSPKSNRARHIWRVTFFFKLANKYQINNTVMFNNLFSRFWQVINLVKKDQHSLKSCVDLFFLNFVFYVLMRSIKNVCQTRFQHIFNFMFSRRYLLQIRLKYFKTKLFYLH